MGPCGTPHARVSTFEKLEFKSLRNLMEKRVKIRGLKRSVVERLTQLFNFRRVESLKGTKLVSSNALQFQGLQLWNTKWL